MIKNSQQAHTYGISLSIEIALSPPPQDEEEEEEEEKWTGAKIGIKAEFGADTYQTASNIPNTNSPLCGPLRREEVPCNDEAYKYMVSDRVPLQRYCAW